MKRNQYLRHRRKEEPICRLGRNPREEAGELGE